jgi:phosphate regulon transcriptional regulator PhoB
MSPTPMPQKILVIEDDQDLCALLEYNLAQRGYEVATIQRLNGAMDKVREVSPDLILLDVMLPDGDGFSFCRELRAEPPFADVPILFLTARSEEADKVEGLEIGADDYITKPFSPRELMARVKAHLRRQRSAPEEESNSYGPFLLHIAARRALLNGKPLSLTATEFRLLEFFMSNAGKVFRREQILGAVWGNDRHVTPRNVDVHIRRLREQIEEAPDKPQWLQTVRGFGYRFEAPS